MDRPKPNSEARAFRTPSPDAHVESVLEFPVENGKIVVYTRNMGNNITADEMIERRADLDITGNRNRPRFTPKQFQREDAIIRAAVAKKITNKAN